jgi:hypothetical protein
VTRRRISKQAHDLPQRCVQALTDHYCRGASMARTMRQADGILAWRTAGVAPCPLLDAIVGRDTLPRGRLRAVVQGGRRMNKGLSSTG